MAKKKKKRVSQMPPLSLIDKLIYYTLLLLLAAIYVLLIVVPLILRNRIAFSDEAVVAACDDVSTLWMLVPWMTFFLMTIILWNHYYSGRFPIFGKQNFQYGPPAWPKIYPLFMKNKPYVWISERAKKSRRNLAIFLLVLLLVSFIPLPWSLYGRSCLLSSGTITQYNICNHAAQEFSSGEIADIEIEAYRYTTGKHARTRHWSVQMTFTTDSGKVYKFNAASFRDNRDSDSAFWLLSMLRLKSRYDPSIIHYKGVEHLTHVITDRMLSQEEANLLYQLFGQI